MQLTQYEFGAMLKIMKNRWREVGSDMLLHLEERGIAMARQESYANWTWSLTDKGRQYFTEYQR